MEDTYSIASTRLFSFTSNETINNSIVPMKLQYNTQVK